MKHIISDIQHTNITFYIKCIRNRLFRFESKSIYIHQQFDA
ncbi:hypothetical protein ENTCAN_05334 [Enterobacter cancerogenus ATCC 35316]|nr:hypothetical protein ENTCAN_05334 [Enterobacter cancerogenus ATCC 35316]